MRPSRRATRLPLPALLLALAAGPLGAQAALPDLVVTGLGSSPAAPTAGGAVLFSATVKNQGAATLPAGSVLGVAFSVDGAKVSWASATTSAPLAPGASLTLNATGGPLKTATWLATQGAHTLSALADDVNRIAESDETNNRLSAPLSVAAPMPDLTVTGLSWTPASPLPGQPVAFSAVLKNQGTAPVPAGTALAFQVDGAKVASALTTAPLAPGATVTLGADAAWTAVLGSHTASALADEAGAVAESDETNNRLSLPLAVVGPQPDLAIAGLSWSPAAPTAGNPVLFTAVVKNQGAATLPAGSVLGVAFSVDGAKVSWASATTSAPLAPGASLTLNATGGPLKTATWLATQGAHTLSALADDVNRIAESDETNNRLSAPLTVAAPMPDLTVTGLSWTPASPLPGQPVAFSAVLKNQGTAPVPAGTALAFQVDGAKVASALTTAPLAPGATLTLAADGAAAWAATLGPHTVSALADETGAVAESDETNNQLSAPLTILAPQPDLVVTGITWTPAPVTGAPIVFSATLKNQGTAPVLPGSGTANTLGVAFWVDGVKASWASTNTATLAPGASLVLTAVNGPQKLPSWTGVVGTHTVMAMADDVNRIPESDETNNQLSVKMAVSTPLPDLVLTGLAWSPAAPLPGDPVTFSATVRNDGTAPLKAGPGTASLLGVDFRVDGTPAAAGQTRTLTLAPGQSAVLSASGTWSATAGAHRVSAVVDAPNRVPETDETNNRFETALSLAAAPQPDIAVTDLAWDRPDAAPGTPVTFSATVRNQGNGPLQAGSGLLALSFTVDGQEVGTASASADLAPGAVRTLSAALPWTAAAGRHLVGARVAPLPGAAAGARELPWTLAAVPAPDLVVTGIQWWPENPLPGDAVRFAATVRNQGNGPLPAGATLGLSFLVDGAKVTWTSLRSAALAPGASLTLQATAGAVVVPKTPGSEFWWATAGTHSVRAVVDEAGLLAEGAEDNNALEASLAVSAGTPDQVGAWSPVYSWVVDPKMPEVSTPIHLHVLPNGKVLSWSRDADDDSDPTAACAPTLSYLWDPATPEQPPVVVPSPALVDCIFCAGHSFLPDGRLLVTGGHIRDYCGLRTTYVYDYAANAWTKGPDMNAGRWYPSNLTLPSGEVLVGGGTDETNKPNLLPQVWTTPTGGGWRNLGAVSLNMGYYPWLYVSPSGRPFWAGGTARSGFLDAAGSGAWAPVGATALGLYGNRGNGSSVVYEEGKVLNVGGRSALDGAPTATAELVDLNAATPTDTWTGPMAQPREYPTATLLPDGTVLVTGGTAHANNDWEGAVYTPELWDPAAGTWTRMAAHQVPRIYHSVAALLPDATVLVGGGGLPPFTGAVLEAPYARPGAHPDVEIYRPPYLFKGPRPVLASAPASVTYGQSFSVATPDAARIAKAVWIRLPSVTHAFNQSQGVNRLAFAAAEGGLTLTAPASPNACPPGPYMLFILDGLGVPSVAKIVSIQ